MQSMSRSRLFSRHRVHRTSTDGVNFGVDSKVKAFETRVVAITGACGAIGEAIARSFAFAGAQLAICDLRRSEIERLGAELRAAGTAVCAAVVDVADEMQVRDFCRSIDEEFGHIDCLINTVGVIDNAGDVETLATEVWDRSVAVNLTSAFLMAKYSVPLLKLKGGAIVNLASVSGFANQANFMVYSVTKAALLSLTRSEAIDLARYGIRAVAICPGSVQTPLIEQQLHTTAERLSRVAEDLRRNWQSQYPTGRFSTPQEVADLTLFLCSDHASNITGTGVVLDGGLTALLPER